MTDGEPSLHPTVTGETPSAVTVRSVGLLRFEEWRRPPDAHRTVVRGGRHEPRDGGVPAHAVDGARVARQLGDGQLAATVPDVHLVVWAGTGRGQRDRLRKTLDKLKYKPSHDYFAMNIMHILFLEKTYAIHILGSSRW